MEVKKLKRAVLSNKVVLEKMCEGCYNIRYVNRHKKGFREVHNFHSLVWDIGDFFNRIEKPVQGGTEITVMLKRQWLEKDDHCRVLDALIKEKELKEQSSSFVAKELESSPLDQ